MGIPENEDSRPIFTRVGVGYGISHKGIGKKRDWFPLTPPLPLCNFLHVSNEHTFYPNLSNEDNRH